MNRQVITDPRGRKQDAFVEGDNNIPVGPPLDITDVLGLPEPFSTSLHNELHARKIFDYASVTKNRNALQGALQSALLIDSQRLTEAFYLYENPQEVPNGRK